MKPAAHWWPMLGLAVFVAASASSVAWAGLVGGNFQISGPGPWFPDVAYNNVDHKYLVVYPYYGMNPARIWGRLVTADGVAEASEFPISESGGLWPAVAYNPSTGEFLVTWDDQRGEPYAIYGQRVRGSDGSLAGGNFKISDALGWRSTVACSSAAAGYCYLVAWWDNTSEIRAQRVSAAGALLGSNVNLSNNSAFSGYPAVGYGLSGNQFLVTWNHEPPGNDNFGLIRGIRVDALTGNPLGVAFDLTGQGTEYHSNIAYDPGHARWLVQFSQSNAGRSSDQYGIFVNTSGTLGEAVTIAATTAFEGDTISGGDIAFEPGIGRYLGGFHSEPESNGAAAHELSASGLPVRGITFLSYDEGGSVGVAADTDHGRFLAVWQRPVGGTYVIFGQLYEPLHPVINLAAVPGIRTATLSWTNPSTPDFAATVIRSKTSGYPTRPDDGQLVVEKANTPGSIDSYVHAELLGGVRMYYAAFAHDASAVWSDPVATSAIPRGLGDFDHDNDVDQDDFGHFQQCLSGDGSARSADCIDADFDADSDVDQGDLAAFIRCLSGAGSLAQANCDE